MSSRARSSRLFLRALKYYRPDLGKVGCLLFVICLSTIFGLMQAWPIAILLDSVLSTTSRTDWMHQLLLAPLPHSRLGQIVGLATLTLAFRIGQELLNMVRTLLNHHINFNGLMRIRCELFRKVQALSLDFHQATPEADTIYRLSYDTFGCLVILNTFVTVAIALFTLMMMTGLMLSRNGILTALALSVAPLLVGVNIWCGRALKARTKEGKQKDSEYLSLIQRSVRTIGLTQAYRRESREFERFVAAANSNIHAWLRMHWQEVVYALLVGCIFGLGGTLIFGYGGYLVYRDQFLHPVPNGMTVGDLMVVLTYLSQLYDPLTKLTGAGATVVGGTAAAARVFEVLDRATSITDATDARELPRQPREIRLDSVSFGYRPGERVLREASAVIEPGQMVAFVGPSGAGKSTLLNLLPRFYDPQDGAIRLDGHDLRTLSIDCVRKHIAVVPQESLLLPTSIAENIGYGRPEASEDEIREAARLAGADEFISALPNGYETQIDECGKNLSGGQKQRLSIARALVSRAPILILDEPTSALDPEHEHWVTETLARLRGQRTIIVVSHRLSSIIASDQIFMMKRGEIIERGTHNELIQRRGWYYSMARYQLQLEQDDLEADSVLRPQSGSSKTYSVPPGRHEIANRGLS